MIQVGGREWALLTSDASRGNGGTSPPPTSSPPPTGAFEVTSIDIGASPSSIDGELCGTTVAYTVTFHLAPNGPGGVIAFSYSFSNGRGDDPGQVTVPPGHTVASTTLSRSEPNIGDPTSYPPLLVLVDSPNSLESSPGGPTGQCVQPIPST